VIKILYIHGFGGHGNNEKAAALQAAVPDSVVISPQFSNNVSDIEQNILLAESLAREEHADIVVGTSLGGFTALLMDSADCLKIVHNPCLRPSLILPQLTSLSHADSGVFASLEKKLPLHNDIPSACGLFARDDELFSYKELFDSYYSRKGLWIDGGHHLIVPTVQRFLAPFLIDRFAERTCLNSPNVLR
jgi:predicted esterase YcpF (UPF0227 family)